MGDISSNVYERLPNDLHGRHSFQDPEESTKYVSKRHFIHYLEFQIGV